MGCTHYTVDAKKTFVEDAIFPAIRANADYEGYPLSTSIARPVIARKAVEIGLKEHCTVFAHGCTGKGNDQFRLESGIRAACPGAEIIAPIRDLGWSRIEEIEYAQQHCVPIDQTTVKVWSIDENLWGRSIEGGRLEETDYVPPEEIYEWTKSPLEAPDLPRMLRIGFEDGVPVSIDGRTMNGLDLIVEMNQIAGAHGVGRIDMMEDRMLGIKCRENYECPAAVVLLTAHKALEHLVLSFEELQFKAHVDQKWSQLAYFGLLFDPLAEDLDAFISSCSKRVTGEVQTKLYKGGLAVVGRSSPNSLYDEELASFDSKVLDQKQVAGTVFLHGIQGKIYQKQQHAVPEQPAKAKESDGSTVVVRQV
jgi:argininosuccinate synthase